MPANLVIFDPQFNRACTGNCCQIKHLAAAAFPADRLRVSTLRNLEDRPGDPEPDLIVLRAPVDRPLLEVVGPLRERWRSAPVLAALCGVSPDVHELLNSLQHGLDDFLCCPFTEVDFMARFLKWWPQLRLLGSEQLAVLRDFNLETLVGESAAFLQAVARIPPVAGSGATVLIDGETGVGKELFARAIHYNSARKSCPFIPVNCSALPDYLFENELFGHAKGAYTDARTTERGLLAEAEGGTVFLDEVDMLTPSSQAKLLRFLQDREYRPLGSSKTLVADTRVIAATNSDLRDLVGRRQFREDLFHRLNVLSLNVPPLRERTSDLPLLANHFLRRFSAQYNRGPIRVSVGALRKMLSYSWPGNVRELEGLLHRAVVFGSSDFLEPEDIEVPSACAVLVAGLSDKDHAMVEFERSYLTSMLAEHQGNVSRAARAAGKDRRTFQRLLRRHGIERLAFSAANY